MADAALVTRRYSIPEVFQTSAVSSLSACLLALRSGLRSRTSPADLQSALQDSHADASVEGIEAAARRAGLALAQQIRPQALLLSPTLSSCLPAITTFDAPQGEVRTVVLWRACGPWVQIMDPDAGRSWMSRRALLKSVHAGEYSVAKAAWLECLASPAFAAELQQQMRTLGLPVLMWPDRAHQAAALGLAGALRDAGQLLPGPETHKLWALCAVNPAEIPQRFWPVRPDPADANRVIVRGPLLLSVTGIAESGIAASCPAGPAEPSQSPAIADIFTSIWMPVWDALRGAGWRVPAIILAALSAAAVGTVIEALLFRGLFDLGRHLQSTAERLGAMAALVLFLTILLALDWPAAVGMYRLGRRLELLLRTRFLLKIPAMSAAGSQSHRFGDLAFRAHWLFSPRQLIETIGFSFYLLANIVLTGAAIVWVYPGSFLLATVAVIGAGFLPAFFFPAMARRDVRYREHSAALGSMYWDCLQGARVIQAHAAQPGMRAAFSAQLCQWAGAGLRLQWAFARAESTQLAIACLCTIGLVYRQAAVQQSPAGLLLLIFWATSIPVLGRELAAQVRSIPAMRSTLLRFHELMQPVATAATEVAPAAAPEPARTPAGVSIDFSEVSVSMSGRTILDRINLYVGCGEHVGIVGVSGAGKSTLLGCLLGWHGTDSGRLQVDGAPLDAAHLTRLRGDTVWVDPQVHLFRASLFENLRYGNEHTPAAQIGEALEAADLGRVLECAPQGLQTPVGESGSQLAGGEGQRLRIGRAIARSGVRLAILDEPARGLGREQRRRLIAALRRRFSSATLLCATHDIADTLEFDRVLVIDGGRIVEQGCPRMLSAADSRYRALLDEERAVNRDAWTLPGWRHLHLQAGALREGGTMGEVRAIGEGRAKQL